MAAPVAVPLAPGICVADDDGQSVFGLRRGVDDHTGSEAGDPELGLAPETVGGDSPGVGDWQLDTVICGGTAERVSYPVDLMAGCVAGHQCEFSLTAFEQPGLSLLAGWRG